METFKIINAILNAKTRIQADGVNGTLTTYDAEATVIGIAHELGIFSEYLAEKAVQEHEQLQAEDRMDKIARRLSLTKPNP